MQLDYILPITAYNESPHAVMHGIRLGQPDFSPSSRSLAFTLRYPDFDEYLRVIVNAYWEALDFELPLPAPTEAWHRIIDTAIPSPEDYIELGESPPVNTGTYRAQPRSCVVLMMVGA
jgi:isoamylase